LDGVVWWYLFCDDRLWRCRFALRLFRRKEKEEFIMSKVLLHTFLVFATGGIWGVVLIVRYLIKN